MSLEILENVDDVFQKEEFVVSETEIETENEEINYNDYSSTGVSDIDSASSISPEQGLNRYLQHIKTYPILTHEQEIALSESWVKNKDQKALQILVNTHLRFVVRIASGYRGYGLPIAELISEGNIGLIQAVKRFDPDRGFRLATYALWWIKASIQEYILHSWSLVKIGTTAAQKKLFFNLRKVKERMKYYGDGDLLDEQVEYIATELNVAQKEVVSMNRRLMGSDHSLNLGIKDDSETEWQDWLVDDVTNQEENYAYNEELEQRKKKLGAAFSCLTDREKVIIYERKLSENPKTLEVLSARFKVSRERVRQIETRAMEKLKGFILQN